MKIRHLTAADYERMPWERGQGSTTQLLSEPAADGGFNWRVSIAEVGQSGPFSDFTGYDRIITLIEGNGIVLTFNDSMERRIDKPFAPLPFDGGWKTDCRLIDCPLRDFNLMVARKWGHGFLTILRLDQGENCEIGESPAIVLHVFSGAADLDLGTAKATLTAGDTLHLQAAPDSLLVAKSTAIIAAIYLEPRI